MPANSSSVAEPLGDGGEADGGDCLTHPALFEGGRDGGEEAGIFERFDDIVACPIPHTGILDRRFQLVHGGQHDDREPGVFFPDFAEKFLAGYAGHVQVEDDQRGFHTGEEGEDRGGVGDGLDGGVSRSQQDPGEDGEQHGVVVDEEDKVFLHGGVPAAPPHQLGNVK